MRRSGERREGGQSRDSLCVEYGLSYKTIVAIISASTKSGYALRLRNSEGESIIDTDDGEFGEEDIEIDEPGLELALQGKAGPNGDGDYRKALISVEQDVLLGQMDEVKQERELVLKDFHNWLTLYSEQVPGSYGAKMSANHLSQVALCLVNVELKMSSILSSIAILGKYNGKK